MTAPFAFDADAAATAPFEPSTIGDPERLRADATAVTESVATGDETGLKHSTVGEVRPRRELVLLALVCCAPYLALMVDFFDNLWQRPHYQFFPIVFVAAIVLVWQRVQQFSGWRRGYTRLGLAGIALAYTTLLAATAACSPWLGYLSFLLMLTSLTHCLGGLSLVRLLAPVVLLLLFVLPPPFYWDQDLIQRMQGFATREAGVLLDELHVPHLIQGNTIIVPDRSLFVEEACSGVHSLTSVLVVTMVFVVWQQRHWLHALILLSLSVLWVVAANVLRITIIGYAQVKLHRDLSVGWQHQLLGAGLFALCLGLVVSSDCLLRLFYRVRTLNVPAKQRPARRSMRIVSISKGWRWAALALGTICFTVTAYRVGVGFIFSATQSDYMIEVEDSLMPLQWKSLSRPADTVRHSSRVSSVSFGDYSSSWNYRSGPWGAVLSVDYPFFEWHDLKVCYLGNGWQVKSQRIVQVEKGCYEIVELVHPELGSGRLYYTLVTEDGRYLNAPGYAAEGFWQERVAKFRRPSRLPAAYQVQVLLQGWGTPPPALIADAESLFFRATEIVPENLPNMKAAH